MRNSKIVQSKVQVEIFKYGEKLGSFKIGNRVSSIEMSIGLLREEILFSLHVKIKISLLRKYRFLTWI